jgi:hypothetical protein
VANSDDCDDQVVGPCDQKGGCSQVGTRGVHMLGWIGLLVAVARRRRPRAD